MSRVHQSNSDFLKPSLYRGANRIRHQIAGANAFRDHIALHRRGSILDRFSFASDGRSASNKSISSMIFEDFHSENDVAVRWRIAIADVILQIRVVKAFRRSSSAPIIPVKPPTRPQSAISVSDGKRFLAPTDHASFRRQHSNPRSASDTKFVSNFIE